MQMHGVTHVCFLTYVPSTPGLAPSFRFVVVDICGGQYEPLGQFQLMDCAEDPGKGSKMETRPFSI